MTLPIPHKNHEKISELFDSLDVSEPTRKEYKARIDIFIRHVGATGLTHNSFLEFKRSLSARQDLSVATKNKYLATARIFLKELNRRGLIPADITQNVKSFSQSHKHKREGLDAKEIERLVGMLNQLPSTPRNTRLRALFCLLAFQGLRQVEIARLDVEDLDLANKTALIRGKGRDDKELIYLSPETATHMKVYLKANRVRSGALFKSLGNRKSGRISTMTIKRDMKSLFSALDIAKTVHGFRHFYITTLLQKLDVRDVRKFSRHRNLEMLIVYDDELDTKHKAEDVFQCFENLKITPSNDR